MSCQWPQRRSRTSWITLLRVHFFRFVVEFCSEVTKLPLGLWVFGAIGNIATFFGAFAECVPVGLHSYRANWPRIRSRGRPRTSGLEYAFSVESRHRSFG